MHIHCLGINHHTAEVSLREQLAFSDDSLKAALARLGCGRGMRPQACTEMVILSTCNRVEIYALAPQESFRVLEEFLAEAQDVPRSIFAEQLYRYSGERAVAHLLRVAAGLDSLVLGEPQILGQVMHAFELARGQNTVGPVLSRLFQLALRAGKRARTETAIGQNPASISSVAIRLAERVVNDLPAARILVLGAGEMAELSVEALRKRGVTDIQVMNRTQERARLLAQRWGGEVATYEHLPQAMQRADVVIASTGAPHTILHAEMIARSLDERERPLVIIDIAVPRDVDPEVGSLPGVSLYDMDSLQAHLAHSLSERAREIPRVEAILAELENEFQEYLAMLEVFPLIAEMHQRAESIRQQELEKTFRRLPHLSDAERQHLNALTQTLVKKILHAPTTRLRSAANQPEAADYTSVARLLFDLDTGRTAR